MTEVVFEVGERDYDKGHKSYFAEMLARVSQSCYAADCSSTFDLDSKFMN